VGKTISNLFGASQGDSGALGQAQQDARGFYEEGSKDYAAQAQNRTAFGNQLAQGALGQGPSIANAQMQLAQDRNLSQQMAAARSNRSVNPALAFRQTQRAGEEGSQQIAAASGIARLQEQQQNQNQYQNYLGGIQQQRGQALGLNVSAANGISQANQANANSQNQFAGSLISGAAQAGAMYASGGTSMTAQGGGGAGSGPLKTLVGGQSMAAHGALVTGPEVVSGDSTANDVMPYKLSSGEMIVPKSVVEQGHKAVGSFAEQLLKMHGQSLAKSSTGASSHNFKAVLAAKAKKV
jgi:hypothetical protein